MEGETDVEGILEEVHQLTGTSANDVTRREMLGMLNRRMLRVAKGDRDWPTLQTLSPLGVRVAGGDTPTIASGDPFVPAPHGARALKVIRYNDGTKDRITQVSPASLAESYDDTDTGKPGYFAIVGETAQHSKLAANDLLKVVGDTANDNACIVQVDYAPVGGVDGELITEKLQGLFSSGVSLTKQARAGWSVHRISVNKNWVGDLELQLSNGTQIGYFGSHFQPGAGMPAQRVLSRPLLRLGPTPDADYNATLVWQRLPRKLVSTTDTPEIPITNYLVPAVAADWMMSKRRFADANHFERQARGALGDERLDEPIPESPGPALGSFGSQTGYCED